MVVTDYSQSGEQAAILAWADERPPGRFLDLGAGNGVDFSNTRALFERGWQGVCVEAAAWAFDLLSLLYADAPTVECVNAAVTVADEGLIDFFYTRGDHLSSTEEKQAGKWPEVRLEPVRVMACPLGLLLDDLCSHHGSFAMVSIDTEATSVRLLEEFSEHPAWAAVDCVCVEAQDAVEREEIKVICGDWDELAVTPNNMVLAR